MDQLQRVQSKIYEIRGQRVMLDRDLAELYGVETRVLNQAVRRNKERFDGEDFMFQLTKEELSRSQIVISENGSGSNINDLKSQIVTSSWGGTRKLPYAFTELGVAMLSSVLKSSAAIEVNRGIMRAFVAVRQMVALPHTNKIADLQRQIDDLKAYIEEVFADYNDINEQTGIQLDLINWSLAQLQADRKRDDKPSKRIGFVQDDDK